MNLQKIQNIFIVGIKGAGMANIAISLKQMGKQVSGADVADEFITDQNLLKYGIEIVAGFSTDFLPAKTELVLFSASHGGASNPLVTEAHKRKITVMNQAEFLGEYMSLFKGSLAVCGTHGKTTTASLISYILDQAGYQPSYIVGTPEFNGMPGGHFGKTDLFILEADEYGVDPPRDTTPKLRYYHPSSLICTAVDFDHPDVYRDIQQTRNEFLRFIKGVSSRQEPAKAFLCADDDNLQEIMKILPAGSFTTFGFSASADYRINNATYGGDITQFELTHKGLKAGVYTVKLSGNRILANVAGAVAYLFTLGLLPGTINAHLADFTGAKRRFEHTYSSNGYEIYDDYAHHPSEIIATLEAARKKYPERKIVIIFQPHTYSRTQSLKTEFVRALHQADYAFLAPVFASAREKSETSTVTSEDLVAEARSLNIGNLESFGERDELMLLIKNHAATPTVYFTMGAGNVYRYKDDIIKALQGPD